MPWEDPIVEKVREARAAYAQRFNYDLDAMYRDLKKRETQSGRVVVRCPAKNSSQHSETVISGQWSVVRTDGESGEGEREAS